MAFPRLSKLEWAVLIAIVLMIVLLLGPSPPQVWFGDFQLSITVDESEPIERESVRLATFWSNADAELAMNSSGEHEPGFYPPRFTNDFKITIDVPAFGQHETWRRPSTYYQPRFLVVEYRLASGTHPQVARKCFSIPTGRGPRSMTILLP